MLNVQNSAHLCRKILRLVCIDLTVKSFSDRTEKSLIDCIPANSRMCAVRLNEFVRRKKDCDTHQCVFIVSTYAVTECSSDEGKGEFCQVVCS